MLDRTRVDIIVEFGYEKGSRVVDFCTDGSSSMVNTNFQN